MRGDSGYAYLPAGQAEVEFAKYRRQIEALQAEIDRMMPVVEAAQVLVKSLRRHDPASWSGSEEALERTVTAYETKDQRA